MLGRKVNRFQGEYFIRFTLQQRMEHWVVMICFFMLLLTGLPQRYFDSPVSFWLVNHMGGIAMTRLIHRVCGIIFSALVLYHLARVSFLVLTLRVQPLLIPTAKDVRDAIQTLKHHLGLTKEEPEFDCFDYRQKFEYWGLVMGGLLMIVTGFILYFPTLAARFLPGEVIPAAKIAHSYEAMLALLVVVVWHLYGVIFNPDTFPLDRSIFTGKVPLERARRERPLDYRRRLMESLREDAHKA